MRVEMLSNPGPRKTILVRIVADDDKELELPKDISSSTKVNEVQTTGECVQNAILSIRETACKNQTLFCVMGAIDEVVSHSTGQQWVRDLISESTELASLGLTTNSDKLLLRNVLSRYLDYSIFIPDESARQWKTVKDIVECINAGGKAKPEPKPAKSEPIVFSDGFLLYT